MALAPDFIRNDDTPVSTSEDKLTKARELGKKFFDLDAEVDALEDKLSKKKAERLELQQKTIPVFFNDAGIDSIGLPEDKVDIKIEPYYKASISAEWTPEQIEEGFEVLEDLDGGDIIRAVFTVDFLKEEYEDAKELQEFIRTQWPKANLHPSKITKSVPWNSLTKFVKEYTEDESTDPLTDEQKRALGATIGHIAKIKPRKDK